MSTYYRCYALALLYIILAASSRVAVATGPEAFLGIEEIRDGWMSQYGGLDSMKVSYSERLLEFQRPSGDPNASPPAERLHVERIEQGRRYHLRLSDAEEGFARPESIHLQAFDGDCTTVYWSDRKLGTVRAGLTKTSYDSMNDFREHLLLDPVITPDHRGGIATCQFYLTHSNTKVLSHLESVAGLLCHVVENQWDRGRVRIWLAHDRSFLPLKCERVVGDTFREERIVHELRSVETDTGTLWYPARARRVVMTELAGTITTEMTASEFVPNVAVDAEVFRVVFPPGVDVVDRVRHIQYVMSDDPNDLQEIQELSLSLAQAEADAGNGAQDADGDGPRHVAGGLFAAERQTGALADISGGLELWRKLLVLVGGFGMVVILGLLVRKHWILSRNGGI